MRRNETVTGKACVLLCLVLASCQGEGVTKVPAPAAAAGASTAVNARPQSNAQSELSSLLERLGVRYLPDEGRIEVSGWVNMQQGLVEVFACAPDGKTHESVVVLDCVPSGLHAGLLALGLQPGSPVEYGTDGSYQPPTGDLVQVQVRVTAPDGSETVVPAEDWVWNENRQQSMSRGPWIFAGSFLLPDATQEGSGTYAANTIKSLVTTYHDATSVLENPLSDGVDDTLYYSNPRAVPAVGTPVTVLFSPARTAPAPAPDR